MSFISILVVSDNEAIVREFVALLKDEPELVAGRSFRFACHPNNAALKNREINDYVLEPLSIKQNYKQMAQEYDLIISAHCKQLFPAELVEKCRCINIHPGYNPYNRGWYPQVFSILNGLPLGATIHEIDKKLDHGNIIDREKIELEPSDTSLTAYNRVRALEFVLIRRNLPKILEDNYETHKPEKEGNINFRKDFVELRHIDLNRRVTYQEAIDRLRALSHPPFKNAYFIDPKTGRKIWLTLGLEKDEAKDE